mmetsp:Transcript_31189/g.36388  ORF Transcript_31189/g.36388 Transcript_31189/m.36388 type:complete len:223 (-) Transcript_31189:67-735(-)
MISSTAKLVSSTSIRHFKIGSCIRSSHASKLPHQKQMRFKSTPSSSEKNVAKPTQTKKTSEPSLSYSNPNLDPHDVSDQMIRNSATEIRLSGTEALDSLSLEQKMKNYGLALSLIGFVTGVWYYSIQAVGNPQGGMDELMADAAEARKTQSSKQDSDKSIEDLAQLDLTMSQLDGDDVIVAVAADDEIAQREEELNMNASGKNKSNGGRPLWKKVIFFWKKD